MRERFRHAGFSEATAKERVAVYSYLDDLVVHVPAFFAQEVTPLANEALRPMGEIVHTGNLCAWSLKTPRPEGLPEGFGGQMAFPSSGHPTGRVRTDGRMRLCR